MRSADRFSLIWLTAFSAVTFLAFALDKWRAGRSGRRVSEKILVLLGALGGWPGGLAGMIVFRHKTAKGTFKFKYTLALVPFGLEVWAWWHWR